MPDQTPASTQEQNGQTAKAEESFLKEGTAWWEQKLLDPNLSAEGRNELLGKIRGYEKGFKTLRDEHSRRMAELSERERRVEEVATKLESLQSNPTARNMASARTAGTKLLDSLMESAGDPQHRETLRQLREIIREETRSDELEKELKSTKELLQTFQTSAQSTRQQQLERELPELTKRFGDDLVDKYRAIIVNEGLKYPAMTARKLLNAIADPEELDQAQEVVKRRQQPDSPKPKPNPTSVQTEHPSAKLEKTQNAQTIRRQQSQLLQEGVKKAFGLGFGKS